MRQSVNAAETMIETTMRDDLPLEVTHEVRDRCLCLHLQRAARAIGRRFDDALRPLGLTNGQFSILISLNRPTPPRIGDMADFLAMDRTTLTAALKPLERRGLIVIGTDERDKRSRRPVLTEAGRDLLVRAFPIWRRTHDDIDEALAGGGMAPPGSLLGALSRAGTLARD